MCGRSGPAAIIFLSTPSLRRATKSASRSYKSVFIFLSTPSLRRATGFINGMIQAVVFLSTPSLRRATARTLISVPQRLISIHALLAEGDRESLVLSTTCMQISIHALLAEGDTKNFVSLAIDKNFYPRPPCGGRPGTSSPSWVPLPNFYPRPPCGGRLDLLHPLLLQGDFYPRPPCGGRQAFAAALGDYTVFLSTPSLRRATVPYRKSRDIEGISIHALLAEGDIDILCECSDTEISIHALLAEGDRSVMVYPPVCTRYFYPRPPCGGRQIPAPQMGARF